MAVQDLLPTLAALAAVPLKPAKPLDGVNCWPAIRDRKPIERPPVIVGGEGGGFAVLDGKWKLIWDSVGLNLFDIVRDPIEAHDLSAEQPLKAAELADRLRPIHQAMKELNP
jgi:arylsulfatase A-like enzyme